MRQGTWTAHHTINGQAAAVSTFTNMPAAETFLFSSYRHVIMVDITGMSKVRFKVNKQATAATSGAKLILRYSPTFSTTPASYIDIGVSEVSVDVDVANTYLSSEWIDINPDCFVYDDIYLAVIGVGGNGTIDPQFGNISVSFC